VPVQSCPVRRYREFRPISSGTTSDACTRAEMQKGTHKAPAQMKRMLVVSTIAGSRAVDKHRSELTEHFSRHTIRLTRAPSAKPAKHGGRATAATARVAVLADVDRCSYIVNKGPGSVGMTEQDRAENAGAES
jgi:hypothetical protein